MSWSGSCNTVSSSLQLAETNYEETSHDSSTQVRAWNDWLPADPGDLRVARGSGADLTPHSRADNVIHEPNGNQVNRVLRQQLLVVMVSGLVACAGTGGSAQKSDKQDELSREQELERRLEVRQGAYKPLPEAVPEETQPLIVGEVPDATITAVKDDLAKKLDTSIDAIDVVMSRSVTWSDGSLGCARPGQVYTQALVPGYQVVLEVEGRRYDYRATEGGYFFLCELPTLSQPSTNL